jgi:hypothetical protein
MERRIIHLNIADFSVAVERLLDRPQQQGADHRRAGAAGRGLRHERRGLRDGVRKGMLLALARRRCRPPWCCRPGPDSTTRRWVAAWSTPCTTRPWSNGRRQRPPLSRCHRHAPAVRPAAGHRLALRNTLRRDLGLDPIWSVGPTSWWPRWRAGWSSPAASTSSPAARRPPSSPPCPWPAARPAAGDLIFPAGPGEHPPGAPGRALRSRSLACSAISGPATSTRRCAALTRPRWIPPERAAGIDSYRTLFSPDTNEERLVRSRPGGPWCSRRAAVCAAAGSAAAGSPCSLRLHRRPHGVVRQAVAPNCRLRRSRPRTAGPHRPVPGLAPTRPAAATDPLPARSCSIRCANSPCLPRRSRAVKKRSSARPATPSAPAAAR